MRKPTGYGTTLALAQICRVQFLDAIRKIRQPQELRGVPYGGSLGRRLPADDRCDPEERRQSEDQGGRNALEDDAAFVTICAVVSGTR